MKQKKKTAQSHLIAHNIETLCSMIWSLKPTPAYQGEKAPSSKNRRSFYASNRIQ